MLPFRTVLSSEMRSLCLRLTRGVRASRLLSSSVGSCEGVFLLLL